MLASHKNTTNIKDAESDVDVITQVLAASSDACWCMEFGVPVDLTAPDQEVVRQVFENDPRWRLSNPAMAQLYLLPCDQVFNERPVREIFPRNKQNEEFVLNLLANGFEVDAAPALDTRYDGVPIFVENDVRAHIRNGKLLRVFGVVRDVGKQQRREAELQSQLRSTILVLESIPCAVFGVSACGDIVVANVAAERLLTCKSSEIVHQNLTEVVARVFGSPTGNALREAIKESIDGSCQSAVTFLDKPSNGSWSVCLPTDTATMAVVVAVSQLGQKVEHA